MALNRQLMETEEKTFGLEWSHDTVTWVAALYLGIKVQSGLGGLL